MKTTRTQTLSISIPTSSSGLISETLLKVTLDTDYDRCVGVAVYAVTGSTGGSNTTYYNVGLKHAGNQLLDLVHKDNWLANTAVPIREHIKPVDFDCDGKTTVLQVEIPDGITTNGTLALQAVFYLTKEPRTTVYNP